MSTELARVSSSWSSYSSWHDHKYHHHPHCHHGCRTWQSCQQYLSQGCFMIMIINLMITIHPSSSQYQLHILIISFIIITVSTSFVHGRCVVIRYDDHDEDRKILYIRISCSNNKNCIHSLHMIPSMIFLVMVSPSIDDHWWIIFL